MTTTNWHKRGDIEGNLTDAEWSEAKALAVVDGKWTTVRQGQVTNNRPVRCPDCGGYDCGPNCNANNPAANRLPASGNQYTDQIGLEERAGELGL